MNQNDPLQQQLARLDGVKLLHLGKSDITLGGLVTALLIILAAYIASRLLGGAFRRLRARAGDAAPQIYLFERLVTYGLVAMGVVAAFSTLGLDLTSFALFAGALGVGLGFGLQGLFREFFSGLVLLFDKLVRIGDYIELQSGERGVVQEIGPRAVRIRNNDDLDVLIPNSRLIEAPVTNWTHMGGTRRLHVPFHVAYGVDKEKVRDAVLKAAHDVPFTLKDTGQRRTQVWLVGFGDAGLKFELVVWPSLDAVKRPNAATAAYIWAIEDALRAAGFEIPFPSRDVRVRGEAAEAIRSVASVARRSKAGPDRASTNDAADDVLNPLQIDPPDAADTPPA